MCRAQCSWRIVYAEKPQLGMAVQKHEQYHGSTALWEETRVLYAQGSSMTSAHLQQAGGGAGDIAGVGPTPQPELRQEAELRTSYSHVICRTVSRDLLLTTGKAAHDLQPAAGGYAGILQAPGAISWLCGSTQE